MELVRGKISHIVYTPDDIRVNKITFTRVFESFDDCNVTFGVLGQVEDNDIYIKDRETVVIYGKEYNVDFAEYCNMDGRISRVRIQALAELIN